MDGPQRASVQGRASLGKGVLFLKCSLILILIFIFFIVVQAGEQFVGFCLCVCLFSF